MARVRRLAAPAFAPASARRLGWPALIRQWLTSPVVGVAGMLVLLALGLSVLSARHSGGFARLIETDAQLLAHVQEGPEPAIDALGLSADEELAGELHEVDQLILAQETGQSASRWIEQAVELLDRVEESDEEPATDDHEWIEELRRIDQATVGWPS